MKSYIVIKKNELGLPLGLLQSLFPFHRCGNIDGNQLAPGHRAKQLLDLGYRSMKSISKWRPQSKLLRVVKSLEG